MNWPTAFVVLGVLFILCAFTAAQRLIALEERRQGKALAERLDTLEKELSEAQRTLKGVLTLTSSRKVGTF